VVWCWGGHFDGIVVVRRSGVVSVLLQSCILSVLRSGRFGFMDFRLIDCSSAPSYSLDRSRHLDFHRSNGSLWMCIYFLTSGPAGEVVLSSSSENQACSMASLANAALSFAFFHLKATSNARMFSLSINSGSDVFGRDLIEGRALCGSCTSFTILRSSFCPLCGLSSSREYGMHLSHVETEYHEDPFGLMEAFVTRMSLFSPEHVPKVGMGAVSRHHDWKRIR